MIDLPDEATVSELSACFAMGRLRSVRQLQDSAVWRHRSAHYFLARTLEKHAIGRSAETSSASTVGQDYSSEKGIRPRLMRNLLKQSLVVGCGHSECEFYSGPGLRELGAHCPEGFPAPAAQM